MRAGKRSAASRYLSAADSARFLTGEAVRLVCAGRKRLLPLAQAIARVFARLGEKKNRSRARIKFLVQDLGIEKFRELVLEERKTLSPDPRWTDFVRRRRSASKNTPLRPGGELRRIRGSPAFQRWLKHNTRPQKQAGYRHGDCRASSGRHYRRPACAPWPTSLAASRKETVRTTVEQNFAHPLGQQKRFARNFTRRWKPRALRQPGAGDDRRCRHLPRHGYLQAGNLLFARTRRRNCASVWLKRVHSSMSPSKICTSRSAAASIAAASITWRTWAFTASAAKSAGYAVPHFQVVLGGEWEHNGGVVWLARVAIPSKNIPEVVDAPHVALFRQSGQRARASRTSSSAWAKSS